MNKQPCNCGNALSGAEEYRMNGDKMGTAILTVRAKRMERQFLARVNGKIEQGNTGDWLVADIQNNKFIILDEDFKRLYEKVIT